MSRQTDGRSRPSRWGQPGLALIGASVVLPVVLFAFAAWYSYRETLRDAEVRVERTVRVLEEHALKVFESHRLVIDEVNLRLRFMDWAREADRLDLHKMLLRIQDDLDQVSTVTIVDADGHMLASGRTYPDNPSLDFADRDWFRALRAGASVLPYVSSSYPGRQSGQAVFNLAGRISTGNAGAFAGAIAVSADRSYFEHIYKAIEPAYDHQILLVRGDGDILAAEPKTKQTSLPAASIFRRDMKTSTVGGYTRRSTLDGVDRIYGFRKVGPYPVFVRFGITTAAALAPWRTALVDYGIVAALAALALLAASALAVRQTERERVARRRWEETAAALQAEAAERERIEEQLRQSQKMEAVGRLTGGIAHDFNNLLTAIIGSLDLVRRRPEGIGPRNLQFIANALEGAQRAAALTSRLLAFSRQQPLRPSRVDANTLVGGMSDLLGRTLGERVTVETGLAADLWPTEVDPNQLENAILNLAVNARDAMPGGGVIRVTTANFTLETSAARDADVAAGAYVLVSVADTGTGIPPEIVAKIFEPFFTTKPVGKGTGLGLSQVYGFAKQSGGHISVASTLGEGSMFKLYLPCAPTVAAGGPAAAAVEAAQPVAAGETILVVEDEAMVRRLSVSALEEAGFHVVAAADAAEALDLMQRHDDVVLLFTDVVLPGGMDGRGLAEAILKAKPSLPVLFTSGYERHAIGHGGRFDDGAHLIAKPFTSVTLVAKVNELLGRLSPARARERTVA